MGRLSDGFNAWANGVLDAWVWGWFTPLPLPVRVLIGAHVGVALLVVVFFVYFALGVPVEWARRRVGMWPLRVAAGLLGFALAMLDVALQRRPG